MFSRDAMKCCQISRTVFMAFLLRCRGCIWNATEETRAEPKHTQKHKRVSPPVLRLSFQTRNSHMPRRYYSYTGHDRCCISFSTGGAAYHRKIYFALIRSKVPQSRSPIQNYFLCHSTDSKLCLDYEDRFWFISVGEGDKEKNKFFFVYFYVLNSGETKNCDVFESVATSQRSHELIAMSDRERENKRANELDGIRGRIQTVGRMCGVMFFRLFSVVWRLKRQSSVSKAPGLALCSVPDQEMCLRFRCCSD